MLTLVIQNGKKIKFFHIFLNFCTTFLKKAWVRGVKICFLMPKTRQKCI